MNEKSKQVKQCPCFFSVRFGPSGEVEFIAPIDVSAQELKFSAPLMVLRTPGDQMDRKDILFNWDFCTCHLFYP